jgi:hypothetical protein
MDNDDWLVVMDRQQWLEGVQAINERTRPFGLILSREDALMLLEERSAILKTEQRMEWGPGILPQIIDVFCDSGYIEQEHYAQTLVRLQEMFFYFKNDMNDEITDEELLNFMREQFDEVCFGDLDYLEGTCLALLAEAIRAGYQDYQQTQGKHAFSALDIVPRWDRDIYLQTLRNLCGW